MNEAVEPPVKRRPIEALSWWGLVVFQALLTWIFLYHLVAYSAALPHLYLVTVSYGSLRLMHLIGSVVLNLWAFAGLISLPQRRTVIGILLLTGVIGVVSVGCSMVKWLAMSDAESALSIAYDGNQYRVARVRMIHNEDGDSLYLSYYDYYVGRCDPLGLVCITTKTVDGFDWRFKDPIRVSFEVQNGHLELQIYSNTELLQSIEIAD